MLCNDEIIIRCICGVISARAYAYSRQRNEVDYYDDDDYGGSSGFSYGSSGFSYGTGSAYGTTSYADDGDGEESKSGEDDDEDEDDEDEEEDDDEGVDNEGHKEGKEEISEAADDLSQLKVQES